MKVVLACMAIIATIAVAEGSLEAGIRVKFALGTDPGAGKDYFFIVGRTIAEAVKDGWRQTRRPPGPLPQLVMYCPPDKVLCALYDDLENIAGLQVAINKNDFKDAVFDWGKRGFRDWHTAVDGQCVTMHTIQQYFVSEESLQKSKEERLAAHDTTRVLQENAVWLTGTNGEIRKVSSSEADIIEDNIFTEQSCIPWMGQHWYYNMSSTTPCDAENMYSWFPLTLEGELIATGFMVFGDLPVGKTDWFERPTGAEVKIIVPKAPECMYDMSDNIGTLTMHIYYTNTPWLITC